jgi:glycosyltransferase involved in cell wall biosynthesis
MKLLYVIHQFFPECYSGTEQYCLAAAREARRRGDEVVVLSLVPDFGCEKPPLYLYDQPYDGLRVRRLRHWAHLQPSEHLRDYENPLVAALFRRVLAEERPDAVHFFHLRNLGSDLLTVAHGARVRSVVHLMDFWFLCPRFVLLRSDGTLCDGPPEGGLGCLPCQYPELASAFTDADARDATRAFAAAMRGTPDTTDRAARVAAVLRRKDTLLARLALADVVIAPSRFLAEMFGKNGCDTSRIRVVGYGLEPGRVQRHEVARPRQPLRLGFAGMCSPWKSPHVAVEAVRRTDGPLRLSVHGPIDEPAFADYTRAVRARADGDARISFAGPYAAGDLSRVLADTDLLIVPSTWYENTPFVILEAFAAGVPVAASDLGGMSELIRPGHNGFLFRAGDAEALAAVLRRCLAEPELLARLAPEPPPTIAENYDAFLAAYRGN